jgi:hypothetical protein
MSGTTPIDLTKGKMVTTYFLDERFVRFNIENEDYAAAVSATPQTDEFTFL